MVYAALLLALSTVNPMQGGLVMLAFAGSDDKARVKHGGDITGQREQRLGARLDIRGFSLSALPNMNASAAGPD